MPFAPAFDQRPIAVKWGGGFYIIIRINAVSQWEGSIPPLPAVTITPPTGDKLKFINKKETSSTNLEDRPDIPGFERWSVWDERAGVLDNDNATTQIQVGPGQFYAFGGQFGVQTYLPKVWFDPDGTRHDWEGGAAYNMDASGFFAELTDISAYAKAFAERYLSGIFDYWLIDGTHVHLAAGDEIRSWDLFVETGTPPKPRPPLGTASIDNKYLYSGNLKKDDGAVNMTVAVHVDGFTTTITPGSGIEVSIYKKSDQNQGGVRGVLLDPDQVQGSPVGSAGTGGDDSRTYVVTITPKDNKEFDVTITGGDDGGSGPPTG